jgi:hypothetical protein
MLKKKSILIIILVAAFAIAGCGKKEASLKNETAGDKKEQKDEKKTENITESTPIHYVMEASGEIQGTYDIYAKGKNVKVTMDATMQGHKTSTEMYSDGNMMYMITEIAGTKTGMKMDPKKFKEQNEEKKEFNPMNFREGCKECEKIGTEEIIGKPCIIYQDKHGIKYSVYNEQMPLKVVMPKVTMTAKSLEINASFSDDVFTVPKDINYIEMDKMMDTKDPKNMKDKLKEMEDVMKNYKK